MFQTAVVIVLVVLVSDAAPLPPPNPSGLQRGLDADKRPCCFLEAGIFCRLLCGCCEPNSALSSRSKTGGGIFGEFFHLNSDSLGGLVKPA